MRTTSALAVCELCLCFALACGDHKSASSTGNARVTSACRAVEACTDAATGSQCREIFTQVVVSPSCFDAIEHASCEEHASDTPAYFGTCFESCSAEGNTCTPGGTLHECAELGGSLRQLTLSCSEVCKANKLAYSGVCGTSFGGRTSDTGDKCWCVDSGTQSVANAPAGSFVAQDDAGDAAAACSAIETCGLPCDFVESGYILSKKCVSTILSENCSQLTDSPPQFYKECFPTCSNEALYCNRENNLVSCMHDWSTDSTRWYTGSCESICSNEGGAWDGTCTTSSSGNASCGCGL
jgi:hypothetical protein